MHKVKRGVLLPLSVFLAFFLSLPAWGQEALVVAGSGDSQELLRKIAEAFEEAHPGVRVEVPESVGSSGGIRALDRGECDLARVARPLDEKEQAPGIHSRVFAYSPVVVAANLPARCVDNLTPEQVVAVYSGKVTTWAGLGPCPDHKIYVANREAGDSSRSVLEASLPGFGDIDDPVGKTLFSAPEAVEVLRRYPFTIGYLSSAMVPGPSLTVFSIDGRSPTPEQVGNGTYPLVSPFGLVWKGELSGLKRVFVEFLYGPAARTIILSHGAIPAASLPGSR
ncbi:substrate-binding domain-containing protein [Desulfuromonas sp.]|uniref:substrate-binding domain-containing protein n=1 Tax=Desulfuromonas sp. TaxID=892 RepID=UPI0025BB27A4|nr:substrate-binding domain-containing protein [Desulfuromonas sp.]